VRASAGRPGERLALKLENSGTKQEREKRGREELTMPDTAAIADEICRWIKSGATRTELIAVVAHVANMFPDMTIAELSAAMQEAMAEAERQLVRRH
jgi:hypothetical protein